MTQRSFIDRLSMLMESTIMEVDRRQSESEEAPAEIRMENGLGADVINGHYRGITALIPFHPGDTVMRNPTNWSFEQTLPSGAYRCPNSGRYFDPQGYASGVDISSNPNVSWEHDPDTSMIVMRALRHIPAGEALTRGPEATMGNPT